MPKRDASVMPGSERIKEFTVVKKLGKGAFGTVFQVIRKSDGNTYALKKVNIRSMSTREIEDALNEIRFLASIKHPNIVGFLEAFLNERSMELCIVMEFADGGDLQHKIEECQKRKRYMSEDLIWAYLLQLVDGVVCLHERKVLHRDLKTANLFLTKDQKVKIGDLNVSKLARMGLVKTQIGTPYYMSPEIWQNRPYNDKSDIWSIGCILYEMCALRPPFRGRDLEDLAKRVQAGYYPRIPSQYSSDMDTTIRKLLNLDPRRRPSAKAILELPQVKKRLAKHKKMLMGTLISELQAEGGEMLATIHVPRNIRRITNQLPKPAYPDSRPRSPTAWPVTAPGRAREIHKQVHGLPSTIEEESKATSYSEPKSSRRPAGGHDPASRSDPMQGPRSALADVRSQARAEVGGRYGAGGAARPAYGHGAGRGGRGADGHSVASGYSRASGASAYSRNNAAPSGYANNNRGHNYQRREPASRYAKPSGRAGYPQPAPAQYGRNLPTVVEHKARGASHAGRDHRHRERSGAHASAPGYAGGRRRSSSKPASGGAYAAAYRSPYGQHAPRNGGRAGGAIRAPAAYQPKRYSNNGRGARPSQASVYSAYSRPRGAYSHRSQASQPSWWG